MFFDQPLAKGKILSETPHYHGPIFDVVTQRLMASQLSVT